MPIKTVRVDFSRGLSDGLVRASQGRASAPLEVGDEVLAFDPGDEMEFNGTVERLDDDGFAYLRMDWVDANPQREFNLAPLFEMLTNRALVPLLTGTTSEGLPAASGGQSVFISYCADSPIDVVPAMAAIQNVFLWSFTPDEAKERDQLIWGQFEIGEDEEAERNPALAPLVS